MIYRIVVNGALLDTGYLTRYAVDSAVESLLEGATHGTTAAIWQMAPSGPVGVCIAQYEVQVDGQGVAYTLYRSDK